MIRVMQEAALGQDERITEGTEQHGKRGKNLFKLFHQHIYGFGDRAFDFRREPLADAEVSSFDSIDN
jgi:hypothetical protein